MNDIILWDAFIDKIKINQKTKIYKGLNSGAITKLLFAGALDSMCTERRRAYKSDLEMYQVLHTELLSALKSKAALAKKSKSEIIGLNEVKTDIHLALWRYQVNPLASTPFIDILKGSLGLMGFAKDEARNRYQKFTDANSVIHIVTDEWQRVFSFVGQTFWQQIQKGYVVFHMPGIVTNKVVKRYSNNTKEMMVLSLYTGRENIDNIILWPEYGKNNINPYLKEMIKIGGVYLMEIKPSLKDGKQGGQLKGSQEFRL